jgi:hypothetical protein
MPRKAKDPDVETLAARGRRNERALRSRLRELAVDAAKDPRAALLITLAERMDSGKYAAHDAQQYRLALDSLERSSTTTVGSKVDEVQRRRQQREQEAARAARATEGESDTAP